MSDNWNAFLQQHGAHFEQQDLRYFTQTRDCQAWQDGFLAPLPDLGLIALEGEQAAEFLHNQLTNDVKTLSTDSARLAAYCTPKGRMLASMLLFRSPQQIFLQLPVAILPPLLKRLSMFVMRSKVKLSDASAEVVALGVGGKVAAAALADWFPLLPQQVFDKIGNEHGDLIRMPDAFGAARYLWLLAPAKAQEHWPLLADRLVAAPPRIWRLAEIDAGMPQINAATQEKFVPQMINFELIGGVNFKKGCYPGQEIVARSQYLGKLKRRMYLARVAGEVDAAMVPHAGQEVFSINDPEQPCGMVVNAEADLNQGYRCLVEMKSDLLETEVHLGTLDGPVLGFAELPYPLQ
jgi:folate-binding protein YgfZ